LEEIRLKADTTVIVSPAPKGDFQILKSSNREGGPILGTIGGRIHVDRPSY
jgi:hypothetical protein